MDRNTYPIPYEQRIKLEALHDRIERAVKDGVLPREMAYHEMIERIIDEGIRRWTTPSWLS